MSVSIQDVLALLPQIFPGVQQIPLGHIRPNPDNPGPPVTGDQIQDTAENITARGLLNPIKVMADPANPLAPGVQPHPDNPRLRADGQPWGPGDFNWVILAGELRYRAFGRLNRAAIPAYILNPSPEEVAEIIHLDNDMRDRGWFAAYQSIENLIKANPSLTQGQVAARLKMDRPKVNRALQLLPLLNPEARAFISSVATNSKGNKGFSELAASQLAGLGPGTGLKPGVRKEGEGSQKLWPYPAIPPETQDLVRRTLAVAIDRGMTQAGVKGLVAWVKAGNQPEDYDPKGPSTKGAPVGEEAYSGTGVATPQTAAYSAPAPRNDGKPTSPGKTAEVVGFIGGVLKTLHPKLKKAHQSAWPGVKSFLLGQAKHVLGNLVRGWVVTGLAVLVIVLLLSPHSVVSLYHLVAGYPGAPSQAAPPAEVAHSPQVAADYRLVQSFAGDFYGPDYSNMEGWMAFMEHPIDPIYRVIFYKAFYPPSKMDVIRKLRLKGSFQAGGPPQLLSSDKGGEEFLVQGTASLQSNLKSPGQVVAEGPVALQVYILHSRDGKESKIVEVQETMALAYDWAEAESKVGSQANDVKSESANPASGERPKEAEPVTVTIMATPVAQPTKPQGDDLGKKIGDGVKDLNDATNKANDANSAVDKVKNLLGL